MDVVQQPVHLLHVLAQSLDHRLVLTTEGLEHHRSVLAGPAGSSQGHPELGKVHRVRDAEVLDEIIRERGSVQSAGPGHGQQHCEPLQTQPLRRVQAATDHDRVVPVEPLVPARLPQRQAQSVQDLPGVFRNEDVRQQRFTHGQSPHQVLVRGPVVLTAPQILVEPLVEQPPADVRLGARSVGQAECGPAHEALVAVAAELLERGTEVVPARLPQAVGPHTDPLPGGTHPQRLGQKGGERQQQNFYWMEVPALVRDVGHQLDDVTQEPVRESRVPPRIARQFPLRGVVQRPQPGRDVPRRRQHRPAVPVLRYARPEAGRCHLAHPRVGRLLRSCGRRWRRVVAVVMVMGRVVLHRFRVPHLERRPVDRVVTDPVLCPAPLRHPSRLEATPFPQKGKRTG